MHLAVLILDDDDTPSVEAMFPMWSPPEVHKRLVCIVQALPSGLKAQYIEATLVQSVLALAKHDADMFQEIYY